MFRFTFTALLFCLGISTEMSSQDNSLVFSLNKELSPAAFGSNWGGFVKHDWGLSKGWYLSSGLGLWTWEKNYTFSGPQRKNALSIFPENDFPLKDVVEATDGRVGIAQKKTHTGIDIHLPVFLNVGRRWLPNSDKFSLNTDVGLLASYFYQDLHIFEDEIAIQSGLEINNPSQVNEFGDPTYWLAGKAIRRSIEFGISINLEMTYHFTPRLGIGMNAFLGGYFNYNGYSPIGIHLNYSY